MTVYLSVADTAKLVRKALQESFPGVTFSVRSKSYSGGASIDVRWTDGPAASLVEAVAKTFEGSYFDGSQDLKGSLRCMMDGQMVRFGADFVFCTRQHSDALVERAITALWSRYSANVVGMDRPTAQQYRQGGLWIARIPHMNTDLQTMIGQEIQRRTDRFAKPSNTAARVVFLGNDGNSQKGALHNPDAA